MKKVKNKRLKLIIFAFEGKQNKTESIYFRHFKSSNQSYTLKQTPTGATAPKLMITKIKKIREQWGYSSGDITYIFIDADTKEKYQSLIKLQSTQPKDIHIVITYPCFELWFLNHFVKTTKEFTNSQLICELKKYIPSYEKNIDIYDKIRMNQSIAINNSLFQLNNKNSNTKTEVVNLFTENILLEKD